MITLSKLEARKFILLKQGLLGPYKFSGKKGIMDFVDQVGCIQFDPIDICGKNPELVLQSRVEGFSKSMLYELLYDERKLLDYFDKNLSIIDLNDWKHFEHIRDYYRNHSRGRHEVDSIEDEIKQLLKEKGPMCSKDFKMDRKIDWYWSETKLSRAALETLYFRGDLIVHHKMGAIKYYDLSENHLPKEILEAEDPHDSMFDHQKWRVLRRIASVGLLWNKSSDAFLYIEGFNAKNRNDVFDSLFNEGKIIKVAIEGIKEPLFALKGDDDLLNAVKKEAGWLERTEFIAPLDNLMWDRNLIRAIFDFDYKWEIYTPEAQRKFGYYVLPVLNGTRFVGRIEVVNDRKRNALVVRKLWFEDGVVVTSEMKSQIMACIDRFSIFNLCDKVEYEWINFA
jgi:uncharacterized protein YcaQ